MSDEQHEAILRTLAATRTSELLVQRVQRDPVGVIDALRWAVAQIEKRAPVDEIDVYGMTGSDYIGLDQ